MPTDKSTPAEPTEAPAAAVAVPMAAAPTPARRGLPGLALAGIIVGGVIVAGALFGGGVAVGSALHHQGPGFSNGHMMGQQDDRGNRPGHRDGQFQGKPGFPGGQGVQGPGMQGPGMQGPGQQGPGQQAPAQPAPAPTATK